MLSQCCWQIWVVPYRLSIKSFKKYRFVSTQCDNQNKDKNSMTIEGCCHFPKRCFGKVNPYFDRVSLYLNFIYQIFVASDSCWDLLLRAGEEITKVGKILMWNLGFIKRNKGLCRVYSIYCMAYLIFNFKNNYNNI